MDSLSEKIDKMLEKQKDLQKQVDVPPILLETQESHFEDVEDLDEAVEGGRGASRHHRKHQQRLFGRHRNGFRLPCCVGCGIQSSEILAVMGSIATGCTFLYVLWKHSKTLDAPSNLWKPLKAPEPAAPKPEKAFEPAKKQFFYME